MNTYRYYGKHIMNVTKKWPHPAPILWRGAMG